MYPDLAPAPPAGSKHAIQGTSYPPSPTIQDVRVNHRCRHVPVAEQFLNRSDVVARIEKMRGERMAEGVACRGLRDPGPQGSLANRLLKYRLMEMMPPPPAALRVDVETRGGEDPLPTRLPRRARVLAIERARQFHAPKPPHADRRRAGA